MKRSTRIAWVVLGMAVFSAGGRGQVVEAAAGARPAAVVDERGIAALVAQLGDASYGVREAATKQLKALGISALPAVKEAQKKAADPEVQSRLADIAEALVRSTLWDGKETVAQYAQRMGLPAEKTVTLAAVPNKVEMKFVLIPAGEFTMGSPAEEPERLPWETQHKVRLSKPFLMQTTPMTQGQWKALMPKNPARFQGDALPMDSVSWNDAVEFCAALSAQEHATYRLPSEAQWEFACRAGTATPFNFGDSISPTDANYNASVPYGNSTSALFRVQTTPIETFKPNAWGLFDMHGNVWQWCGDWYADYPQGDAVDPTGPAQGTLRAARGGSWVDIARFLRSACRGKAPPDEGSIQVGFRVVLEVGT